MNRRIIPTAIYRVLISVGLLSAVPAQEQATRSIWDGVYTGEQAKRGQALYRQDCARCHGEDLTGEDEAPPLMGGAFLANWDGLTVGDLFERIRLSMPADQPGSLSRERIADILAYLLSVNQFPSGNAELDRRTEVLKLIRFEAAKPEGKK
jgi:mono/diheme cytochrome c family protein